MSKLYNEDVQRIVTSLSKDVVKLLKEASGRVFLAGGYIRARIAGEEISDIDLWGESAEDLNMRATLFAAQRGVRCISTKNAHTILTPSRLPVQFITRWTFSSPDKCVESFDFTIAGAAVWYEDGAWRSFCLDRFYRDLASKSLVYTSPVRNEDAGGSILRLQKFIRRGYNISPGNHAKVIARLLQGVKYDDFHAKDEEWQARVLLGLLREVDPLSVVDGIELEDEELSAEFKAEIAAINLP